MPILQLKSHNIKTAFNKTIYNKSPFTPVSPAGRGRGVSRRLDNRVSLPTHTPKGAALCGLFRWEGASGKVPRKPHFACYA